MPLISTGIFCHQMRHGSLCRSLSLILVVSLLAPGPGLAQPSPSISPPIGTQPAPPSGTTMRPAQPAVTPSPGAAPASVRGTMPGPDYRLGPGDVLDVQIAGRDPGEQRADERRLTADAEHRHQNGDRKPE